MKILIIDDDQSLTTLYSTSLQQKGYTVDVASKGQEGLELAGTEAPDVILLDQVLPDISGNEVLKQLKSQDTTKNIPVLILSNFSQEELVKEAINSGAADYIFKYQVELSDVAAKIEGLLKKGPENAPQN